jgi:hypothetical protein
MAMQNLNEFKDSSGDGSSSSVATGMMTRDEVFKYE